MESVGIVGVVILLLGSIIFIHELGHFVAAKLIGVKVITFSLGFGKRLWQRKIGDTTFCISAIPLGGYVLPASGPNPTVSPDHKSPKILKTIGQFSAEELKELEASSRASKGTLAHASFLGKLFFYTNGLIFNVVSAYLVVFIYMYTTLNIHHTDPRMIIESVKPDSRVAAAGILPGDRIIGWQGKEVPTVMDLKSSLKKHSGDEPIKIDVIRDNQRLNFTVVPKTVVSPVEKRTRKHLGFQLAGTTGKPALHILAIECMRFLGRNFKAVGLSLVELTGLYQFLPPEKSSDQESDSFNFIGGLAHLGVVASKSLEDFTLYFVLMSISVVLLNALPIPACDGSQILIHVVEGIRGRPVSFAIKERLSCCGLYLVLGLFAVSLLIDVYEVVTRLIT